MDLKKGRNKMKALMASSSFFIIFLGLGISHGYAQGIEAEWRVVRSESVRSVPLYEGLGNPFPMREVVQILEPIQPISILPDTEVKKGELLRDIRLLMEDRGKYIPQTNFLRFKGYLEGQEGPKVLYGDTWIGVGALIQIPVGGIGNIMDLVEQLKRLDADLGQEMHEKVKERIAGGRNMDLKITSITAEKVVLYHENKKYEVTIGHEGL